MTKKMIDKKTWEEFRDSGMLFVANTILHFFGWAIVVKIEDGHLVEVNPARVKYRGFSEEVTKTCHKKVAKYLLENISELYEESIK